MHNVMIRGGGRVHPNTQYITTEYRYTHAHPNVQYMTQQSIALRTHTQTYSTLHNRVTHARTPKHTVLEYITGRAA